MKIAMFPNSSGSSYWRLKDPAKYLQKKGIDARVVSGGITQELVEVADMFVLEGCVDTDGIALLYEYQQEHGKKIIVDMDDDIYITQDNPYKRDHEITKAPEVIAKTLEIADLVTTTTEYLAMKLRRFNRNVVVLPNYPDLERWDIKKYRNDSKQIRIGWAGSFTHLKDLEMVEEPLKRIMDEFPQVQLVTVGDMRIKDLFKGYPIESMLGVGFDYWPARLNGLRLDIGIAPLVHNEFNKCKSPIKFYEYSIAKVPGVFSPTVYDEQYFDGRFGLIAPDKEHWYRCLKNLIICPALRQDLASSSYAHVVKHHSLENHIHEWVTAYNSLLN